MRLRSIRRATIGGLKSIEPRRLPEPDGVTRYVELEGADLGRLGAFAALAGFVFDPLTFFQCPVSLDIDVRLMDKNVLPALFRCDESVALLIVEPFDYTCCHSYLLCRGSRENLPLGVDMPSSRGKRTCLRRYYMKCRAVKPIDGLAMRAPWYW